MKPFLAVGVSIVVTWLSLASGVLAHPVGFGAGGPPLVTTAPFGPGGWVIGSPTAPIGITAVPGHAPWQKVLQPDPQGPVPFSTVFTVTEHIVVGQPGNPGPAWTDWHERIIEPGWDWVGGVITSGGMALPGLVVSLGLPGLLPDLGHSPDIWFDFDPISPGTVITIEKEIHCHITPFCQGPILIHEYPTIKVPEPHTLALLAWGLLGIAALRRKIAQG